MKSSFTTWPSWHLRLTLFQLLLGSVKQFEAAAKDSLLDLMQTDLTLWNKMQNFDMTGRDGWGVKHAIHANTVSKNNFLYKLAILYDIENKVY